MKNDVDKTAFRQEGWWWKVILLTPEIPPERCGQKLWFLWPPWLSGTDFSAQDSRFQKSSGFPLFVPFFGLNLFFFCGCCNHGTCVSPKNHWGKCAEMPLPLRKFAWTLGNHSPRNLANPKKERWGESCCWGGRSSCPKTKNFYGKAKKNIEAQFWFIFFTLYNTRLGGFQFQSCLECFCLDLRNKHNNLTSIGLNGKWCWLSISVICRQDTSPSPSSWLQGKKTTSMLSCERWPFHQRLGHWFSKVQSSGHSTKPIKLADVLTQPFQD